MALILHLDDEPCLLKTVNAFLKEQGHVILSVANSYEALHLLRSEQVDLFIQDLTRSDVLGRAVYNQMKADSKLRDIPVLITSGNLQSWPTIASELKPFNDLFIAKPFALKEFKGAIHQLLSRTNS
jgi:DNA-binding response OmpR family regulator